MKKQRRAKAEDIGTIFRYRGCGFSMEQISEITNLSPQTVSYQLSKLKKLVDDGNIGDVVLYEARHYPASRVLGLEQELAKIIEDHHYEIEKYQNRIVPPIKKDNLALTSIIEKVAHQKKLN